MYYNVKDESMKTFTTLYKNYEWEGSYTIVQYYVSMKRFTSQMKDRENTWDKSVIRKAYSVIPYDTSRPYCYYSIYN